MKKSNSIIIKILTASVILVCGLLWLISGTATDFGFGFNAFWPSLLIGLGLVFALCAFYETSAGYAVLFSLFFVDGVLFLLSNYATDDNGLHIRTTWPFLLSAIMFGALFLAMDKKTNVKFHLRNAVLLLILTVLLYLANIDVIGWVIVGPVIVILTGCNILVSILINRKKSGDDGIYESEDYSDYEKRKESQSAE